MMPRTRNFVLFLVTAMFLVTAISITAWKDLAVGITSNVASVLLAEAPPSDVAALPVPAVEDPRASRLASLREKVAGAMIGAASPDPETQIASSGSTESDETSPEEVSLAPEPRQTTNLQCPTPTVVTGNGFPGITFKETLGQRALVLPSEPVLVAASTSASSSPAMQTDVVVLALPWRSLPLPTPSCITTDVVGIATDGSFIRNNEQAIYRIFGADTLLGYALDGFPIYGSNNGAAVDSCGGAVVNGAYRYYLSADRDSVLGCYAGVPVRL